MCSHAIFQTKTDRPVEDVFCVELRKRRFQEVNETIQFGQSPGISPSISRKGAIRHYMISWIWAGRLSMNDKGPYHSYHMGDVRSGDLPGTRSSASAVERIGEGWLPALRAPDPSPTSKLKSLPQLRRHQQHRIPTQRRQARSHPANGRPRKLLHHRHLRPPLRPGLPRRSRTDLHLTASSTTHATANLRALPRLPKRPKEVAVASPGSSDIRWSDGQPNNGRLIA